MKNSLIPFLLLFFSLQTVCYAVDWSYEANASAKEIYRKRVVQIPCSDIKKLLEKKDYDSTYNAIRDAGLFEDKSCARFIQENNASLKQAHDFIVQGAIPFYKLKMGYKTQLDVLARYFDKEAAKTGDHWTVEIFGFLKDWNTSGRRLVRHSNYSDGTAGELLCSSILWRRFLLGDKAVEDNWKRLVKEEHVDERKSLHLLASCKEVP